MRITVGAGTYVAAVSGGVDSMVLLDLLRKRPGMKLIVAHFDHGIREDSALDRQLVSQVAKNYGLTFLYDEGKLGALASEAVARDARYDFLRKVQQASGAKAIITAHHQDDALETAVLNILRGTGRRGLTSLRSTDGIIRPLLPYTKSQIVDYATDHGLSWREDPTNTDTKYKRNHIRHNVLPKLTDGQRAELLILLERLQELNDVIDNRLTGLLHVQPATDILNRRWFINLPHDVSREVIMAWLRRHGVRNVTKKTIERLVVAAKTGKPDTQADIDHTHKLGIKRQILVLITVSKQ